MARYEHLPIYKKAFDLFLYFEKIVRKFSRYDKYTWREPERLGKVGLFALVLASGLCILLSCSKRPRVAAELQFDAAGNLVFSTGPDGKKTSFQYDARGLRTQVVSSDGSARYGYDAHGNRIWVRDNEGSTEYFYDAFDRLSAAIWDRGPKRLIAYEYDHVGLPARLSVFNLQLLAGVPKFSAQVASLGASGQSDTAKWHERERLVLDLADQLHAAATDGNAPWIANDIAYVRNIQGDLQEIRSEAGTIRFDRSADGSRVERILPNGVRSVFEYTPGGRISGLRHTNSSGQEIASFSYSFDSNGRLSRVTGNEQGRPIETGYVWDDRGRLQKIIVGGSEFIHKYDEQARRLTVTNAGKTATYTFDGLGRIVRAKGIALSPNAQGTMSARRSDNETTDIRYNYQGHPLEIATRNAKTRYSWDGEGNLVSLTFNGRVLHFVPAPGTGIRLPLVEFGGEGALESKQLIGGSVLGRIQNGERQFYLEDASGENTCPCNEGHAVLPRAQPALMSVRYPATNDILVQCGPSQQQQLSDARWQGWWDGFWTSIAANSWNSRQDLTLAYNAAAHNTFYGSSWGQRTLGAVEYVEGFVYGHVFPMQAGQELGEAWGRYQSAGNATNLWTGIGATAGAGFEVITVGEGGLFKAFTKFGFEKLFAKPLSAEYAAILYEDTVVPVLDKLDLWQFHSLQKDVAKDAGEATVRVLSTAVKTVHRSLALGEIPGNAFDIVADLSTSRSDADWLISHNNSHTSPASHAELKSSKQLGRSNYPPSTSAKTKLDLRDQQDSKKKKPDISCTGPSCGGGGSGGPGGGGGNGGGCVGPHCGNGGRGGGGGGPGLGRGPFDSSFKQVGGIDISTMASVLGYIGNISGAVYDPVSGSIVLLSNNSGAAVSGIKAEDFAVALRLAYSESPHEPTFSLDPADPKNPTGPWLQKVYYPDEVLAGTDFGRAMFEADWLLKQYSFGVVAEQGRPQTVRNSSVSSYKSVPTLSLEREYKANQAARMSRFWILSGEMRIRQEGSAIVFDKASMRVKTRLQVVDPHSKTGLSDDNHVKDPIHEEFARRFTEDYDELAAESPKFERVRELAKAVALARWMQQKSIPVNLEGLNLDKTSLQADDPDARRLVPALSTTFEQVRQKAIRDGNREGIETLTRELFLFGGVDLQSTPRYVSDQNLGQLENAVQEKLKQADAPRFDVSYGGQSLTGTVIPLTHAALVRRASAKSFVRDGNIYRFDSRGRVVEMVDKRGDLARYRNVAKGVAGGMEVTGKDGWRAVVQPLNSGTSLQLTTARGNEIDVLSDSGGDVRSIAVDGKPWAEYHKHGAGGSVRLNQGSYSEVVTFDSAGRTTGYQLERPSGPRKTESESARMEYSPEGRPARLSGSGIPETQWQYDVTGRLQRAWSSNGSSITVTYDEGAARTTWEAQTATAGSYSPNGDLAKLVFEHDRLISSESSETGEVNFKYNDHRLAAIHSEHFGETNFSYDKYGRPALVILESGAIVQYSFAERPKEGPPKSTAFKLQLLEPGARRSFSATAKATNVRPAPNEGVVGRQE